MKIEVYKIRSIPWDVLESVSQLLHESFSERREQGINFKCGTFSAQDVDNMFVSGGVFVGGRTKWRDNRNCVLYHEKQKWLQLCFS